MFQRLIPLVFAILALYGGSACSAYRTEETEIHIRYLPAEDAILVLEAQYGVHAKGSASNAAAALQSAAAGHRRYPPEGDLISLDLDRSPIERDQEEWDEKERADFSEFSKAVRVVEAHVFSDGQGHLSFARLTRIDHARKVLEIIDAYWNRQLARDTHENNEFVPEYPIFDETTRDAIRGASTAGHKWLHPDDDALVLDVPMTQRNAARCLSWIKKNGQEPAHKEALQLIDQATSVEITGGHALLRFGEDSKRVTHLFFHDDGPGPDSEIRAALRELKVPIEDAAVFEGMRAKVYPAPK